jgi:putative transferase (TIGR04331 family)
MREIIDTETAAVLRTALVTSDLEATWPAGRPLLFLGDWCLRYSRRHVWSPLNYTVVPYHWDDRGRITKDVAYLNDVYEMLLSELAQVLNDIHGVNYSVRYWRIALGYWLMYFTQIFFDRWQLLHDACRLDPDLLLFRMEQGESLPASADVTNFVAQMQEGWWNERLCAGIADEWTDIKVLPLMAPESRPGGDPDSLQHSHAARRHSLRGRVFFRVSRVQKWLGRFAIFSNQGVALHSPYLRRLLQWRLELLLGQLPTAGGPESLRHEPPDANWRRWKLEIAGADDFTKALAEHVPRYLPTCYLEGYQPATEVANSSGWPKAPRVIMTANSFASDDKWKLWAAERCEAGAKLVIAQHGGHYGTGAWSASQMYEIAISDRYLSWGWSDTNEAKVFPAPSVSLMGMRKRGPANGGICLQVTCALEQQSGLLHSFPLASQLANYLDDQLQFASSLSEEVRQQLVVRLFAQDFDWDLTQRWNDFDPEIVTDSGKTKISKLLSKTRLYVATYNATTFLESFTRDIPTVMFWNPNYWELSKEAQPDFDLLRRASILFDDPVSCANHVSAIWNDIPEWWASSRVQEAVKIFTHKYAYVGPRPLRELKAALTVW